MVGLLAELNVYSNKKDLVKAYVWDNDKSFRSCYILGYGVLVSSR